MNESINLTAILVADAVGFALMIVLLIGNYWRFKERASGNHALMALVVCTMASCFADSTSSMLEGRSGVLVHALVYLLNLYLFAMNMAAGSAWTSFLVSYTNGKVTKWHRIIMNVVNSIGVLGLIVNLFTPVVFAVDGNNVYKRGPLFWLYFAIEIFYMAESIVVYSRARRHGSIMRKFPIWSFLLPVFAGVMAQSLFYGISTIWVGVAVSLGGLMANMQNERIFRDRLTGLYSRFYLDYLKTRAGKHVPHALTLMMLDLNGFKSINDTYGHSVGDQALIDMADVLRAATGKFGPAIRYAGDEFLVLIETNDDLTASQCAAAIRDRIELLNRTGGRKYKLSVSIGYYPFDMKNDSIDYVLSEVDKRMYASKRAYYENSGVHDRRTRES